MKKPKSGEVVVRCPSCKTDWALDHNESREPRFTCTGCNTVFDIAQKASARSAPLILLTVLLLLCWGFFWPHPYKVVICLLAGMPVVSLILSRISWVPKWLIAVMFISTVVLLVRAYTDWHFLYWHEFCWPFICISGGMSLILVFLSWRKWDGMKSIREVLNAIVGLIVLSAIYGYGATMTLNAVFASPAYNSYNSKLENKSTIYGKGFAQYEFTLSPWGPHGEFTEDRPFVNQGVYDRYNVGDTVPIYVGQGKFGIQYYFLK